MAYRQGLMERTGSSQDPLNSARPAEADEAQLKDEHQASEIVRGFSPGELSRDVEILLESLFE